MSTTSVRFSYTSCSSTMLGCWICCRMFTSLSISSRFTPRLLARLCRFLMNLAAYSIPELFSIHRLTTANCPLWTKKRRKNSLTLHLLFYHNDFYYYLHCFIISSCPTVSIIFNNRMELKVQTDVSEEAACQNQLIYRGIVHHFLFPGQTENNRTGRRWRHNCCPPTQATFLPNF